MIDGMSSWWCVVHGYNHPAINAAIEEQLKNMSHVMFGGLTHRPAVELAEKLVEMAPDGIDKVFYCDSGSVAVEVAMKMALQYWYAAGRDDKRHFLTITKGYHGDTWNAMSVCDPVTGMHNIFRGSLPMQYFIHRPEARYGESCLPEHIEELKQSLRNNHNRIAAVILEPIVQGAGGMWFYSADYLRQVRELCNDYDVLLICDEIATGFGRTGKMWGVDHAGIVPDIMCVGKGLTGGAVTLAAAVASTHVAEAISATPPGKFMHGPTFMANPIACAAGVASLRLFEKYDWRAKVAAIETQLKRELEPYREHPNVTDVRVLGAIGVLELRTPPSPVRVQQLVQETGVWLRPFGPWVYAMPPFVTPPEEVAAVTGAMGRMLE